MCILYLGLPGINRACTLLKTTVKYGIFEKSRRDMFGLSSMYRRSHVHFQLIFEPFYFEPLKCSISIFWGKCGGQGLAVLSRLKFWPGNYIWSFKSGIWFIWKVLGLWDRGFYKEFRAESIQQSGLAESIQQSVLAWGAILEHKYQFWLYFLKNNVHLFGTLSQMVSSLNGPDSF